MKKILVGIGDERNLDSLTKYSLEVAKTLDGTLTAIGIVDLWKLQAVGDSFIDTTSNELIDQASKVISNCVESFVTECQKAEVRFGVKREAGNAMRSLLNTARYYDLLVCGLQGMFEHGVAKEPPNELREIVESGVTPILATTSDYRPISNVLISLSQSMESASTLKQYAQLNPFPSANVRVVHFANAETESRLLEEAQEYLGEHGIGCQTIVMPGKPDKTLLPFAKESNTDLIVMGMSAKSLLRQRVFGETAIHLMQNKDIPLFLGR